MVLIASVMGRVFAWEGQQQGHFVHDIVPTAGHEHEQTGASSTTLLNPHTEDAFHPARAHVLMLGCIRNPDNVATHVSSIRHTNISHEDYELLSRPTIQILPDDAYATNESEYKKPLGIRTLWKSQDGLCLRYDPSYTRLLDTNPEHRRAYERLGDELERVVLAVTLQPGDILVLDNDIVVHGRAPFKARYDGTDRWLKRVSVRVPGRCRPKSEQMEDGYGQRVIDS
jgi:alpha-ketoglutarate-dependent taurine dioxygenase